MTKHLPEEQPASPVARIATARPRAAGVTAQPSPESSGREAESEPIVGHSVGETYERRTVMARGRTGDGRPRRLGGRTRKGVLVVHIASAGAWIGIDVVMAVLVFTARLTDDTQTAATCYQALELFAIWPLLAAGVVSLASGVVLGLGSKYGLVRFWWVATKLVLNLLLSALVLIALRPGLGAAAVYGQQLAAGHTATKAPSDLLYPPTVSPVALLIAVVLSVYKPWGRIRKRRASAPRRAASDDDG